MKQCKRCNKINPAEIHTCTPWMRNNDGSMREKQYECPEWNDACWCYETCWWHKNFNSLNKQ